MRRRQFLQTINALGASTVLPASAFYDETTLDTPTAIARTGFANKKVVDTARNGWNIPKLGIVAIGTQGCAVLDEFAGRLPRLAHSIALDTDAASLFRVNADRKILVNDVRAQPLNPHAAGQLALSITREVAEAVAGLDMVLLVTGMDDGSGRVTAPLVAKVLQEQGIFTLAFVTVPSSFESHKTQTTFRELQAHVNTLLPFSHGNLERLAGARDSFTAISSQAAPTLDQLWHGILNKVCRPGLVSFDFEDLLHVLHYEGECGFGFGSASGVNDGLTAARDAINHSLLGMHRLQRASALLITVSTSRKDFLFRHWVTTAKFIKNQSNGPSIIYGWYYDESMGNDTTVSILASGIRDI